MKFNFLLLIALVLAGSLTAAAQSPAIVGTSIVRSSIVGPSIVGSSIVRTWVLTAADKLLPDGTRSHDYGDHPHGLVIFTEDGHYSVQIYSDERTKFAAGDKLEGSPEEYKDAAVGMSVHYGKYSVDAAKNTPLASGTIRFQIERASFPNWDGTTQVRAYELKGDELSWKVPPRPDGSVPITVLKRAKSNR